MLGRRVITGLGLGLLAGAFAWGVFHLMSLRLVRGDIYPAYSTLRADPLGARALHDSLDRLPGLDVERRLQSWKPVTLGRQATAVLLGVRVHQLMEMPQREAEVLDAWLRAGARLVVALHEEPGFRASATTNPPVGPGVSPRTRHPAAPASLLERWGCQVKSFPPRDNAADDVPGAAVRADVAGDWPASIPWRGTLEFDQLTSAWTARYFFAGAPVVIERALGAGQLVMCSDSYLFSNEALRHDRASTWLAAILGPADRILFDETHLGISEEAGVVTFVRQFRLHGFVWGGVLLAGLFLWARCVPLLPALDLGATQRPTAARVAGRNVAVGLVQLLRRSVSPADLPAVCFAEWVRSVGRGRSDLRQRAEAMQVRVALEEARPARERDPVGTYAELARILNERQGHNPRVATHAKNTRPLTSDL